MTFFVASHPCSPASPTRTLKSEDNDGMDSIDYLDPLFPDITSSHLIDNSSTHPYLDHHDICSPSSSSSLHDSSSATTPSPASQYDVLHSEKHIIPSDLLTDNNNSLMESSLPLPDSYHRLTAEFYARSGNNIFNSNNSNSHATASDMSLNEAPSTDNLQIRVLGVPSLGAKSRVETQIKLGLQLLTSNGAKVPHWSYLRLPEHMLARSKLRKTQQQKLLDGSVATMVSDESKVLTLDAQVICSTNATKTVRMCPGCVRRERKRAERTKDGKPRYESDLTCPNGSSTPEQDFNRRAENMLEKDRDRILLFNCSPMVNFSSGDTILPTRITCYCRHHNEKVGFRIQFVMRNDQGFVVAKGCSPPIMITDDHKSAKQRNNSLSGTSSTNDNNNSDASGKKRGRSDYENQQTPDTPAPSRRGSLSENNYNHSNISTTQLQLNPSASFVIPSSTTSPYQYDHPSPRTDGITTPNSSLSSSPQTMLIGNDLVMTPFTSDDTSPYSQTLQHVIPANTMTNLLNGALTNDTTATTNNGNHYSLPPTNNGVSTDGAWPQNRRRRITSNGSYSTDEVTPTWRPDYTPQLERLVPSQGPTYGGVEVTVLGSGFYRGLTCLFGEHAASTVYWNPNTLVCVLPPAATPGPVVVSFKEHPIVLEGQDVALFTYYDASDQALLELALQVVGLKMTGKLHDAKHIAMLIVRGDQQRSQQQQQQQQHQSQQHQHQQQTTDDLEFVTDDDDDDARSILANDSDDDSDNDNDSLDDWSWREGADLEKHIINALEASDAHDVMHTNPSGHTMLHLAVLLRYGALAKMLLNKMDLRVIDQADRNGCTALHFACIQNNAPMVQLLLNAGAQPTEKCNLGSPSTLATDDTVKSLIMQSTPSTSVNATHTTSTSALTPIPPPALPRRLSFKSHVRRFYTLKQRGNDSTIDGTNGQTTVDDLDHNGLGFAQYKHDRRLYLFWLPLLIVTIGLLYYQILGDRTLMNLLQDMIPFQRHELNTIIGY